MRQFNKVIHENPRGGKFQFTQFPHRTLQEIESKTIIMSLGDAWILHLILTIINVLFLSIIYVPFVLEDSLASCNTANVTSEFAQVKMMILSKTP